MGNDPPLKPLIDIPRMADRATDMLRRSLDALVRRDTAVARKVCDDDDEVDSLYDQIYGDLLTDMINDPYRWLRGEANSNSTPAQRRESGAKQVKE